MRNPIAQPGAQDGAMTEVALALAMGFFSILVLTLVSMGGGPGKSPSYEAIRLVQTAPDGPTSVLPTRPPNSKTLFRAAIPSPAKNPRQST